MNCGRDENQTYHIFIHLDANVSSSIQRINREILTREGIMEHFLDTLKHLKHLEFITQEP